MEEELGWNDVETKQNQRQRNKKKKTTSEKNSVEYLLNNYKIRMCHKKKAKEHDNRTCMNAHNEGEIRRLPYRDDQTIRYSKNLCNSMRLNSYCGNGDECLESHNEAEQHFHPAIYKTVLCKRSPSCHIFFCYFAHGPNEMRKPNSRHFDVKKERSVKLCDFIHLPERKDDEVCDADEIEVIRDWTGWQQRIASSELLPHPLEDVYSRMIYKYPEIQSKLREICLAEGCTPYMEVGQRSSHSPVMLLLSAPTRDDICRASSKIDNYLMKCRPKTEEKFPTRFLSYLQNDTEGIRLLKQFCKSNKGIDISVGHEKMAIWGNNENKRQLVLLELKKVCTGFALTDARAIADARLRSLEMELQKTQQQLQSALEDNYKLTKSLKSVQRLASKLKENEIKKTEVLVRQKRLPKYWESTDDYQEFKVGQGSDEWENVETHFLATIGSAYRYKVNSIIRIENHELWDHYALLKKKISIEKDLWHGTAQTSLASICQKGFNR